MPQLWNGSMKFFYGFGGSLLCDEEIPDITQPLDDDSAKWYGDRYFIAESMKRSTAEKIAKLLGGKLEP